MNALNIYGSLIWDLFRIDIQKRCLTFKAFLCTFPKLSLIMRIIAVSFINPRFRKVNRFTLYCSVHTTDMGSDAHLLCYWCFIMLSLAASGCAFQLQCYGTWCTVSWISSWVLQGTDAFAVPLQFPFPDYP